MKPLFAIGLAVCFCASGCDSKNPLSDPKSSKADERLVGVWRERDSDGDDVFYHVGHAGDKFPACMMRVVEVKHRDGNVEPPFEFLVFPSAFGDKTYLNVVASQDGKLIKSLDEKGWNAAEVDCYTLYQYKIDGDKSSLYGMDKNAKIEAITTGKLKGKVTTRTAIFNDSTENLSRFVKEAGDSLWDQKSPGHLERVKVDKTP